jgi:AraC-like DNA-binding protein
MDWHVYLPTSPLLKPFIQCFWYTNGQVEYPREKILPTGTVELIINFADEFRLWDESGSFSLQKEAWLVGLQSRYLLNEPLGHSEMIGIRFCAGGVYPFIDCDAHELHNQVIPMDAIWGESIHFLREALYEAPSLAERFRYLERFLMARLQQNQDLAYIHHAVQTLSQSSGTASIKGLAIQIGISQKHLAHRFKQVVGVSPKSLARLFRFQTVLSSIKPQQNVDWADIANQCRYHDQAHFSKDFSAFTGFSPSQYLKLMQPFLNNNELETTHFVPLKPS